MEVGEITPEQILNHSQENVLYKLLSSSDVIETLSKVHSRLEEIEHISVISEELANERRPCP